MGGPGKVAADRISLVTRRAIVVRGCARHEGNFRRWIIVQVDEETGAKPSAGGRSAYSLLFSKEKEEIGTEERSSMVSKTGTANDGHPSALL
jgi:hypothetical protein